MGTLGELEEEEETSEPRQAAGRREAHAAAWKSAGPAEITAFVGTQAPHDGCGGNASIIQPAACQDALEQGDTLALQVQIQNRDQKQRIRTRRLSGVCLESGPGT